jgi:hypothetical protein
MSKEDTLPGTITIGDDSSSVSVLSAMSSDSEASTGISSS